MGYNGYSFFVPFDKGGLDHNKNIDLLPPEALVHPSRNLNLNLNGRATRGGTSQYYSSAITGTPQIMGIKDYTLIGGTQHIVVVADDGKVYRNSTTTIKTGWTTAEHYADFEIFDNELYIANGYNTPAKWDGSTWTDLSDIPSDWTGINFPQWIVNHGRGASQRLFAGGCPSTPYRIYITPNGDGDDFSDANVTTIDIDTKDGYGIIGAVEFGDRLFFGGKKKIYLLDDEDSDIANWGYEEAQYEGGVANFRLFAKTTNDVIAMMDDGEIYSATALETYGDYKAASIVRPSFINEWIKEYVDLTKINQFHMIYDPMIRAIKIFAVKYGYSNVNLALVYFIDRGPENGWIIHDNESFDSGYDASASALIKLSTENYSVCTGDYAGMLWTLETSNTHDNGEPFFAGFRTPRFAMYDIRGQKKFSRLWVSVRSNSDRELKINWWVDDVQKEQRTIEFNSTGGRLDSFILGTDKLGGNEMVDSYCDLGDVGKRIQLEIYTNGLAEDYFLSLMSIDYKYLGKVKQARSIVPGERSSNYTRYTNSTS